jgi:alpha-1,3-mannosyltransferase
MRILHTSAHFSPCIGGIERFVEELCNKLIDLGHTSDVLCLNKSYQSNEKLISYEKLGKINVYRVPFIDLEHYKIAPSVLKFIRNYDIIHIHGIGFFSDILTLTKIFHKKPLVLSTHGGVFHTKNISLLKKFYFNFLCKLKIYLINEVIAHSKNDKKLFSKISNPIFIPYAINFKDFVKKKKEKNSFLFVGRLTKNKRVDRLLEATSRLKNKTKDFKLYIVGDGNERLKLEEKCRELGLNDNVYFIGERTGKDILEYYSKSKYFLSASEFEGFGISVIEAMASGCIVIVNDIDVFKDFVINEGNGFLVNYSYPKKASEQIFNIMSMKNLSQISKNAENTAKEYDWENITKRIEKIYMNLVEQ